MLQALREYWKHEARDYSHVLHVDRHIAHNNSVTPAEACNFTISACSRLPLPNTNTLIHQPLLLHGTQAGLYHAVPPSCGYDRRWMVAAHAGPTLGRCARPPWNHKERSPRHSARERMWCRPFEAPGEARLGGEPALR